MWMEGATMQGIHFGLTGLAVMGQNLARHVARHGFPIVVHNRTPARTEEFLPAYASEGHIIGATDVNSFVGALQPPRAILIMVKAGPPIDEVISQLKPHLDRGDVLIDGGNSFYMDTQRRLQALVTDGILYLGTGISGGEEGALHGPSIMPGGSRAAYDIVAQIFTTIAAQVDGTPAVRPSATAAPATTSK
jgi:6-phosphogluconate dehydrogenase